MSPKSLKQTHFLIPILCLHLHLTFHSASGAPSYYNNGFRTGELEIYPQMPNEVLPIQPMLIYPERPEMLYQARNFDTSERDIIFVKLLQGPKSGYRPKKQRVEELPTKELNFKDIFYVKALTNGQFSHERLKVYRVPEFYAISVFRNSKN